MTTADMYDLPAFQELMTKLAAKATERRELRDATRLKVEALEKRIADETKP